MFYYSPKVDMVDMPAIWGQKPWMDSPKHLSLFPSQISASSPYFDESPESLQKQISNLPSDWYPIFYSAAASPYHTFLHYPSSRFQTLQQPRKASNKMLSQNRLTTHDTESGEDLGEIQPSSESQRSPAYCQSVSSFMAQPDFKVALSSNGSTYCESDLDSLEQFDETFITGTTDTYCGLVHPIPKSSVYIAANNISFLSRSGDAPSLPSFKIQGSSPEEPFFASHTNLVSDPVHYNTDASLSHTHSTHLMASTHHPDAKYSSCDDASAWAPWAPGTTSYGWCPNRDLHDTTYDSSWHSPTPYHVPWFVQSHPYNRPEGIYDPPIPLNEISNGLPNVPSTHHPNLLTSPSTLIYQPCPSNSAPPTGSAEAHPRQYLLTQSAYIPSTHNVDSDTDTGSPLQKPLGSLSPPSFTPSVTEEESSPQQTGDGQSGIEANMHYSDERNAFLIDCKRRGLSYKDIKRVGGFKEAESTLRGRFRTLTKSKDQRVRKPKWQDKDVS
jgi:hypothetical protein